MHMIKQEVKKKNPQSDLIQQIVCLKETDLVLRIEGIWTAHPICRSMAEKVAQLPYCT